MKKVFIIVIFILISSFIFYVRKISKNIDDYIKFTIYDISLNKINLYNILSFYSNKNNYIENIMKVTVNIKSNLPFPFLIRKLNIIAYENNKKVSSISSSKLIVIKKGLTNILLDVSFYNSKDVINILKRINNNEKVLLSIELYINVLGVNIKKSLNYYLENV